MVHASGTAGRKAAPNVTKRFCLCFALETHCNGCNQHFLALQRVLKLMHERQRAAVEVVCIRSERVSCPVQGPGASALRSDPGTNNEGFCVKTVEALRKGNSFGKQVSTYTETSDEPAAPCRRISGLCRSRH